MTADAGSHSAADRPASLAQRAYERIRHELLAKRAGAFGGRLVEHQLARELEMSRTPVRDALRRLALAGLVEPAPGGGYAPRRVRLRDVNEQYELRLVLEPEAAALAAEHTGSSLAALLDDGDDPAAMGAAFHLAIAKASNNLVLARSIAAINEQSFLHRMSGISDRAALERMRGGHEEVRRAVTASDPEAARATMTVHLVLARDMFVAELRSSARATR
jgi:DNA-binding GntR family transcriptional regulator